VRSPPDLPGRGLSDSIELPRHRYRETAVAWLDDVLDSLELDTVAVDGHSGGGRWGLWYALARSHRVKRLVLIGVPALPKTRCPLPIRLIAMPGGGLLSRLVPPSPKSVLRFASFVGEKATLAAHPDLVDLMVATGRDPIAASSARSEIRVLVSPFALLSPSGFRRHTRVRPDKLRQLAMPTLIVWGEHDPLGTSSVAQQATKIIPHGQLVVLPTGHAPWLGWPAETAAAIVDFVR
jgi:pimeloyl-ACP methyl ester carboxylesterase